MAEVHEVSSVPEQPRLQQVDQQMAPGSGSAQVMLPPNATLADLERLAKPVADAIKFAVALHICNASKRSQDRIHQLRLESERR